MCSFPLAADWCRPAGERPWASPSWERPSRSAISWRWWWTSRRPCRRCTDRPRGSVQRSARRLDDGHPFVDIRLDLAGIIRRRRTRTDIVALLRQFLAHLVVGQDLDALVVEPRHDRRPRLRPCPQPSGTRRLL